MSKKVLKSAIHNVQSKTSIIKIMSCCNSSKALDLIQAFSEWVSFSFV